MIISPEHLQTIQTILKTYLPLNTTVWVFGSRAHGPARKFSDLDLLFDQQGNALPDSVRIQMTEAFDNSALPYSVDLVDWNAISDDFKRQIQDKRVIFSLS